MKKICVVNFWDGAFDSDFFDYFFNISLDGVEYTDNQLDADLVITSVFGNIKTDSYKTVCFIGENIRPSFLGYNYSLSFDHDTYSGRNFRLPLWYSRLKWPGLRSKLRDINPRNHGYEEAIPLDRLTKPRLYYNTEKLFCAMVAGNPEGLRISMFESLSKYKAVDGYGNLFSNPLIGSKLSILNKYRFSLCPENSIYNGYVTEKIVDAYAAGCVPIYSGDLSISSDFNSRSFLNYQNFLDMDIFVREIAMIDQDKDRFTQIYSEPLILHPPSLDEAIKFVRNIAGLL